MALRILVVDDHEAARRGIASILAKHPDWHVCGEAADGVEAIARAKELRPDAVLMDVSMPKMDGLDASRALRRELPGTKIVLISQNYLSVVCQQAAQVQADAYLGKEALAAQLIPSIEKLFARLLPQEHGDPLSGGDSEEVSAWLQGGGEMGKLIRATDWTQTPLGPSTSWSPALRMIVRFLLANRFPQLLWWGPEFCSVYNDAYIPILGTKHPWALGRPVSEVWNEIWDVLKPLIETPFSGGPATWMEDIPLEINRRGFLEETHFTIAYSPVPDESVPGGIGGVLATVHEITEKVVGERRVCALRDLGARSVEPKSVEEACVIIREALSPHSRDIPFLLLYVLDEKRQNASLVCRIGADQHDQACPASVDLIPRNGEVWPLSEALATEDMQTVEGLKGRFDRVPEGPWSDAPDRAAVLPIRSNIQHQLAGFMVAGLSSRLEFDKGYRDFLELMSTQIATTIANARAYEEERKRSEALAEIDRAKTLFFSNVSHEFRTPLTLMLGPLEDTLASGKGLSEEHRNNLQVAHRNSLRLLKLVNTLLDFSRIEAGRIQACYEPTDVASLTAELASLFRSAVERAGLRFLVHCDLSTDLVYVDREMWEKIVFNLLSNAFKFTFKGEIEVALTKAGNAAELRVRDTGTGIPVEDLSHLFERFYRVEGARGRTWEGSGIGLALVQELAKLHGGSVQVESELGRGSVFTVTIPLGKDHLPAERIGAARTLASTGVSAGAYVEEALHWSASMPDISDDIEIASFFSTRAAPSSAETNSQQLGHILLADDNADMRQYLETLLNERYRVIPCEDGQVALERARQTRPDLVLADVMMPRMDGFSLLRALREDKELHDVPVVLLSARAGEESRIEGLHAGADDYLVKPFSARELMARVGTHLAMAKARRESAELERTLRAEAEHERRRLHELFMQAPAAIGFLSGPEHRFTFVNHEYIKATGRQKVEDFVGRTVGEAFPELADQGVLELLDGVYQTGVPYAATARKVVLNRGPNGRPEETYFDFVYHPMHDSLDRVAGILIHSVDVTQQVRVRQELEKREQQFREMIDALPAAIYTTDAEGRLTHFNPAAIDFSGREPELGTDQWCISWKLYHPDGRPMPHDECPMAVALKGGQVIKGTEAIAERPDGSRRWFIPFPTPLWDHQGKIVGGINMLLDITERKDAERATSLLAAIVDSSDDAIISKNLDGTITSWNKGAERLFGYTVPEAVGQHITLIVPWERRAEEEDILRRLARGERVDHFETVRRRKDGGTFDVSLTISPLHESSGRVVGASNIARDISERKRIERALRESEERFRALVNATSYVVYRVSPDWSEMRQFEGNGSLPDTGKLTKEWLQEYVHPDDRALVLQTIREALRTKTMLQLEYRVRRSDGGLGWTYSRAVPLLDVKGDIIEWFGAASDVTARKEAEESYRKLAETLDAEVRARTRDLEERNTEILRQSEQVRELSWRLLRAQDEERRHIARELHDSAGQTLTVLGMNLAQLVQKTGRAAPELATEAESIQEIVQQLHRDIRTTSYLLHPPLLDENGLYSALSWYTQGLAERSSLEIKLDISHDFGRLPRDLELAVFRLVQECLTNVHRHSGSKTAKIRIAREDGQIAVEIQDRGQGMSAQRLAEIQSGGSGVGIRGMRERLSQFKGLMKIESDHTGTRILVSIPVANSRVSEEDAAADSLQAAG